jgi:hypothetical protein
VPYNYTHCIQHSPLKRIFNPTPNCQRVYTTSGAFSPRPVGPHHPHFAPNTSITRWCHSTTQVVSNTARLCTSPSFYTAASVFLPLPTCCHRSSVLSPLPFHSHHFQYTPVSFNHPHRIRQACSCTLSHARAHRVTVVFTAVIELTPAISAYHAHLTSTHRGKAGSS